MSEELKPEKLKMEDIPRFKMEDIPKKVWRKVCKKWVGVLKQAEEYLEYDYCIKDDNWYWKECALCAYIKKYWEKKCIFDIDDGSDDKCFYLCPMPDKFYCVGGRGIKSSLYHNYRGHKGDRRTWLEAIKSFLEFLKPYI